MQENKNNVFSTNSFSYERHFKCPVSIIRLQFWVRIFDLKRIINIRNGKKTITKS